MASPAFARLAVASMGLASLAFSSLAFASTAGAAVLHVPGDFPTIQGCIDAAIPGDECVVAPGTYNELINFHGKAITLRSSDGPEVTIIDAGPVPEPPEGKPVVRCDSGEGPGTVLDGFTIAGGTGVKGGACSDSNSSSCGGGMYNVGASPTVTNCTFSGNTVGSHGGGMGNIASSPAVTDCTFTDNLAGQSGAGMANTAGNPTVSNCIFSGNSAGLGGGMSNFNSSPMVATCAFSGNSAIFGRGGAMYNSSSAPDVTNCTFSDNIAEQRGGGMYNKAGNPTVTDCTFSGNFAGEDGGGMWNIHHNFGAGNVTVTNCTFSGNTVGNHGGGMYNTTSGPTVTNCTFSGNTAGSHGGGLYNRGSHPTVSGCMFSGNSALSGGAVWNLGSSPTMTNCTLSGNAALISGGGIFSITTSAGHSAPGLINCVMWGNAPDEIVDFDGAVTTVSYGNIQGGLPVGVVDAGGNINADPLFVRDPSDGGDGWGDDPGTPGVDEGANDDFGDLRLLFGSPCINTGDNAALPADVGDLDGDGDTLEAIPFDLDGHARVLCTFVDMGAYESGIGDDDCDGIVGLGDFAAYFDCLTGPAGGFVVGCEPFDFNGDGKVDLADLGAFQMAFTGSP